MMNEQGIGWRYGVAVDKVTYLKFRRITGREWKWISLFVFDRVQAVVHNIKYEAKGINYRRCIAAHEVCLLITQAPTYMRIIHQVSRLRLENPDQNNIPSIIVKNYQMRHWMKWFENKTLQTNHTHSLFYLVLINIDACDDPCLFITDLLLDQDSLKQNICCLDYIFTTWNRYITANVEIGRNLPWWSVLWLD